MDNLKIRKSVLGKIDYEFEKMNRRADKLGCPPVSYEIVREWNYIVHEDPMTGAILLHPYHIPMVDIEVRGIAPKFEGWTFLGTLEHTEGGNILRSVPGETIPEEFRNVERKCDHCKLNRIRKDTFVVRHEDGRMLQVGRQCVHDFLGHRSPENIVRWADFMVRLGEWDGSEYGMGGWNIKEDPTVDMTDLLAVTSAYISKYGWVPASDDWNHPTKERVLNHFFPPRTNSMNEKWEMEKERANPTDGDYEFAEKAREWALNVEPTTDYLGNVKVIAANDYVGIRQFGIACSIVGVYKKNVERDLRNNTEFINDWFGEVKERVDLTIKILNTFEKEGYYGLTTIVKMVTADGYRAVWFASGSTDLTQGKTYKVKATIKKHNEWKGSKETVVNRVKVTEEVTDQGKLDFMEEEKELFTFEPTISVYCKTCKMWVDEKTVKFENIEEDITGRDILTFICPTCSTSNRVMDDVIRIEPTAAYLIGKWLAKCEKARKRKDELNKKEGDLTFDEHLEATRFHKECRNFWWGIRALNRISIACEEATHFSIAIGNHMRHVADYIEKYLGVDPMKEWNK